MATLISAAKTSSSNEDSSDAMKEADFLNVCGTKYQHKGMYTKAISLYRRSLKCVSSHTKSNFNMGTCLCELANKQEAQNEKIKMAFYKKAMVHYESVAKQLEEALLSTLQNKNGSGIKFENSKNVSINDSDVDVEEMIDMYASSLLNMAALEMKFDKLDAAHKNIMKILEFNDRYAIPIGKQTIKEAYYSLNSILRRMGKKDEAVKHFRKKMNRAIDEGGEINEKVEIKPMNASLLSQYDYGNHEESNSNTTNGILTYDNDVDLAVICVKWGNKYGLDYLINLYSAVERNLTIPHTFYCLTDDVHNLGTNNNIIGIPLEKGKRWTGWWNKATLFSQRVYSKMHKNTKRVLYIDLDTVIIGSLDNIVCNYSGSFSILSTNGLDNEGKDFTNGYNSSIMMWNCNVQKLLHETIYKPLLHHMDIVQNFIYRFDHWLEMNVDHADLLQNLYPNAILEYRHDCKNGKLPEHGLGCIVNFPLKPKPHEVVMKDSWVAKYWLAKSAGKE